MFYMLKTTLKIIHIFHIFHFFFCNIRPSKQILKYYKKNLNKFHLKLFHKLIKKSTFQIIEKLQRNSFKKAFILTLDNDIKMARS